MTDGERIGRRFGRLVVESVGRERRGKRNMIIARCRCDCGTVKDVFWEGLAKGRTRSCGCLKKELVAERLRRLATKHGGRYTRLYKIFNGMKDRCYNHHNANYARYGGRGITICNEWRCDFAAFREWAMSHGYADDLSIDRIDNDRGYSPDNCRWADAKTQCNNFTRNHRITVNGQTHTMAEWSRLTGVHASAILKRLKRGWSAARAVGVCNG